MKIIAACLACVISSFSTFSAQMASQQWVRDYVETNSSRGGVTADWVKTYHADHSVSGAVSEAWVKDYVNGAINGESRRLPTTVSIQNDQGEPESVTFNWTVNTNAAMIVDGSSVPGMTNGTKFALLSGYNYRNTGNSACKYITGMYEDYGYKLTDGYWQYVTNGVEVTTNAVYATTNDYWTVRYHAVIDDVEYISYPISPGYHICTVFTTNDVNLSTNVFYLKSCLISDEEKRKLLSEPTVARSRWSLFDLIFPSAYAMKFNEDGEWIPGKADNESLTEQHFDGDPGYTEYYYYGHWYTEDVDCTTIGLSSFKWTTATGQSATYDVGYKCLEIFAGDDLCNYREDYNALKSNYGSVEAQVVATAKDEIEQAISKAEGPQKAKNRMAQLNRQPGFDQALKDMVAEYYTWLAIRFNGRNCPEEKTETVRDKKKDPEPTPTPSPDPEPDPEPPSPPSPPPVPHSCAHGNLKGNCEKWTCGFCRQTVTAAVAQKFGLHTVHHYDWDDGGRFCMKCKNVNNGVPCLVSYAGQGMEQRHTGWHNEYITLSGGNADYPGWMPTYYYTDKKGTPIGCYERCAGRACLRNHDLVRMDEWVQIVDEHDNVDDLQDARVYRCENKKYADSSDDICGFGDDGDVNDMIAAGVWKRAQHNFVSPYNIKGHESERWKASTDDPDNVCTIQRYCQHQTDEFGNNCGCGLAESDLHKGEHKWYPTKSLGEGEQWVCGHGGDNGDPDRHYEVMKCAHDLYYQNRSWHHHGCGMTRRPGSANYTGESHRKVYPKKTHKISEDEHAMTVTCEKHDFGCDFTTNIVKQHNYQFSHYTNITESTHTTVEKCKDAPYGDNPGCDDAKSTIEDHGERYMGLQYLNNSDHGDKHVCPKCNRQYVKNIVSHPCWQEPDSKWDTHIWERDEPSAGGGGMFCIWGMHSSSHHCACGGLIKQPYLIACDYEWQLSGDGTTDHGHCKLCLHTVDNPCHATEYDGKTVGTRVFNQSYHACFHTCDTTAGRLVSPAHLFGPHNKEGYTHPETGVFHEGACSVCGYQEGEYYDGNVSPKMPYLNGGTWADFLSKLMTGSTLTGHMSKWKPAVREVDGDEPVYDIGFNALTNAFENCESLHTVKFNFVTNIGENAFVFAFKGCTNLTSVQFRDLEKIEAGAFANSFVDCKPISLTFPSLKKIGGHAFYFCNGITNIVANKVSVIEEVAFQGCVNLQSVSLGATEIGIGVFADCVSLTNINLTSLTTYQYDPYWGIRSGATIHFSDGDFVVP